MREQAAEQRAHGAEVVVDALEQHRVVVDRHAGAEQRLADAGRLGRDLARVVEVRLDPDLLGRGEQVDQLGVVEPLRQRDRHAGADADHVDVVDGLQAVEEEAELADRQRERVAAGDDHVADLRVLADVLDHPLVVAADGVPAAADHRGPLARAEAAVHRADVRGDEQHPVGVAVRQARAPASPCPLRAGRRVRSRRGSRLRAATAPTAAGSGRAGSSGSISEK